MAERLLRSLRRLAIVLVRHERRFAAEQGLSASQVRVLATLRDMAGSDDGTCISQLANDQGLALSTMTRNLALLERKGWLKRVAGETDRRTVLIQLTQEGLQQADRLAQLSHQKLSDVFARTHPSDRLEQAVALNRVAVALEKSTGGDAKESGPHNRGP
ncbi:MAG: MarR family transcriptional regulator [Myxococcota bacterium]